MKILFLSPQPFYQDRGTPIAVHMVLQVLSERGYSVDVITYPEGKDITYNNIKIYRTPAFGFLKDIKPGFSWKKLVCDFFMLAQALRRASQKPYQVIHAVEEAVFIALLIKFIFRIPYVYDMDSSLSQQMIEKNASLSFLLPFFDFIEGLAIKNAKVVIPVCQALAKDLHRKYGVVNVVLLPDVSLV
jgi:hypothetical protein